MSVSAKRKLASAACWASGVLMALCMAGVIVCAVLLAFRMEIDRLLFPLIGGFFGGSVLFALAAVLLEKLTVSLRKRELDARERLVSDDSFFIGDGVLAVFGEKGLVIRSEKDGTGTEAPYGELRFFSICSRSRPREKGEWNVGIEIPVVYLSKDGKGKSEPPVLVAAEMKERLLQCLEKHGLTLLGEKYDPAPAKKKFTRRSALVLPDRIKRRTALWTLAAGGLFVVGGVIAAFLWNVSVGAVIAVFGAFFAGRAVFSYRRARSVLAFYEEGIYWEDAEKARNLFVKWEEIERIVPAEELGERFLRLECAYGVYPVADVPGAVEYLEANMPEKIAKGELL